MAVALLPPIPSCGDRSHVLEVLKTGPSFVRSRNGRYWHRPRSGVRLVALGNLLPERTSYHLWCGQIAHASRIITRQAPPMDLPVCGTCDGRALGAGQIPSETDYATEFTPRGIDPPARCPGSGTDLYERVDAAGRIGRCLVCGELGRLRSAGSTYRSTFGIAIHAPGPGLTGRCDLHGWNLLTVRDGHVVCRCEVAA